MQIRVLGVPQTGAKSRVETQIKLCIQLVTDDGDKAQWWSHLKLPEHRVAKDKLKRQILMSTTANGSKIANVVNDSVMNTAIKPEKMLFLSAQVICASDPSRKVVTCLGCIQRERKRSQRRKENKLKNESSPVDDMMEDEKSLALEEQKVLLFNCSEVVDFSSGDTILPTRITCYCRHHNERLGFCIYFEMHDYQGKQVATGMSPPIMITDDHKSNKVKSTNGRKRLRTTPTPTNTTTTTTTTTTTATTLPQPNPIVDTFDRNRSTLNYQPRSSISSQQQQYHIQPRPAMTPMGSPMTANTPTNASEKAVSPIPSSTPIFTERPLLQRLIPNEGPTFGGVEVTLLGSGFRSGLTCMFGDVAASSTHYWSPNTLVCILPPAAEAGTVVVSFKEHPLVVDSQDVTLFTYYNENDRALMELALQVVGLKMTGKVEDARDIAMRIVQGGGNGGTGSGSNNNNNKNKNNNTNGSDVSSNTNQQQHQISLEYHIIQVLQVMRTFRDVESADVSITSAQGHTMLHLAAMLGFAQLTEALIDMGCDVDMTDKNGYTALHYSAWYNHAPVVQVLLEKGSADPEISNRWNKKPLHLTTSHDIRCKIWNHVPLIEDDGSIVSSYSSSSDRMSADVDTSYAEDETDQESLWLSDDDIEYVDENAWHQSYLSDSEESSSSLDDHPYEGLRRRHHAHQRQLITYQQETPKATSTPTIQYLNEEESTSHSADEIMDAQPLHDSLLDHATDYEDNNIMDYKEMNWMQRTLSHFQQPTNDSFLQNIKNNMPAKPTDLNLKNIADHLLQVPRPAAAMIANMSVLFGTEEQQQQPKEEPAEQTLAWYMALAYAMGARSLNEEAEQEKQAHEPRELSSNTDSTTDTTTSRHEVHMEAQKRRDKRLFSFWVPMLCCKCLIYFFELDTVTN